MPIVVAAEGRLEVYVHSDGRLVVVVEVNCERISSLKQPRFRSWLTNLPLQIAAANPTYISEADIPAEVIEAETKAITERSRAEGKPETIIPKIVEGYLKKFKDEHVLLNQKYIRDESRTVLDLVNDKVSSLGEAHCNPAFHPLDFGRK